MLPLRQDNSALVLVDFQERLAQAMPETPLKQAVAHARILLQSAKVLHIPIVVTEQYSKGLGATLPELKDLAPDLVIDKIAFAATEVPEFNARLDALQKRQVVLMGMETHICVLQTAVGLKNQGYEVWIAAEAVCSRSEKNWQRGLALAERFGIYVAPVESLIFAWLERAGTPEFKTLSAWVREL